MNPRCGVGFAAVCARAVRAGIIASSRGRATTVPMPRKKVRRGRCFLVRNMVLRAILLRKRSCGNDLGSSYHKRDVEDTGWASARGCESVLYTVVVITRGGGMRNKSRVLVYVVCLIVVGVIGGVSLWAQDWTQWRGPNRDGVASFSEPKIWPDKLTTK